MDVCISCGRVVERVFPPETLEPSLGDTQRSLEDVNSEIARVETHLEELKRKRIGLQRQINHLDAPVLRLPPEISSEIFMACIESAWRSRRLLGFPSTFTPLAFGTICSAWRGLAWSMPWIWSRVSVTLDRSSPTFHELLEEWLVRSGQHPLSVHLDGGYDTSGEPWPEYFSPGSHVMKTMEIIMCHSERWHDFSSDMPLKGLHALAGIEYRLPLLTSVKATGADHTEDGELIQIFRFAPRLQTVGLDCLYLDQITLPLHQLTTLKAFFRDSSCLVSLRCARGLVKCSLKGSYFWPEEISPLVAHLSQLTSLKATSHMSCLSHLLDGLALPSIRTLKLSTVSTTFPHRNFISLINRSTCFLTRLRLTEVSISDNDLLECLRVVPSLNNLELRYTSSGPGRYRMLDPSHASDFGLTSPLLPNLQTFNCKDTRIDLRVVVNMLNSRWKVAGTPDGNVPVRLQSARIRMKERCNSDKHTSMLLQQLRAEGMEIHVHP
jgi:hypothetical protein